MWNKLFGNSGEPSFIRSTLFLIIGLVVAYGAASFGYNALREQVYVWRNLPEEAVSNNPQNLVMITKMNQLLNSPTGAQLFRDYKPGGNNPSLGAQALQGLGNTSAKVQAEGIKVKGAYQNWVWIALPIGLVALASFLTKHDKWGDFWEKGGKAAKALGQAGNRPMIPLLGALGLGWWAWSEYKGALFKAGLPVIGLAACFFGVYAAWPSIKGLLENTLTSVTKLAGTWAALSFIWGIVTGISDVAAKPQILTMSTQAMTKGQSLQRLAMSPLGYGTDIGLNAPDATAVIWVIAALAATAFIWFQHNEAGGGGGGGEQK